MLATCARNMGFTSTHKKKKKHDHSPKYVFRLSSKKVCTNAHDTWFETHSSELSLGNTSHLLVPSTILKATPQTSRDLNPGIRGLQLQNYFMNVTDYLISHGICFIVFHTFLTCPIFGLKKILMEPCITLSNQNYIQQKTVQSNGCTLEN